MKRRLLIATAAFAALGMPVAAIGVAWPSLADELGRPLGDLGTWAVIQAVAFGLATMLAGRMIERVGAASILSVSGVGMALACWGLGTADSWAAVIAAGIAIGAAGGGLDATLNTYAALEMTPNHMNTLHAGFGAGAALAPWILTTTLTRGLGWRPGMLVVAGLGGVVGIALVSSFRWWRIEHHSAAVEGDDPIDRRLLTLVLAMFFLASGTEIAGGQWAFTLLTRGRGVSQGMAGLAAGGFFVGLTLSRLLMGVAGHRVGLRRAMTVSLWLVMIAYGLVWWSPWAWLGPFGLILAGFAIGPVFPVQTTLTPSRFGRRVSGRVIGYQIAAAGAGVAVLPWVIGKAVNAAGVEMVGVVLALGAVALGVVGWMLARFEPAIGS